MSENEKNNISELEILLRTESSQLTPDLLRRFASECCRRVSFLCADPIYLSLIEFAEKRESGPLLDAQLATLRADAGRLYDALYPGYGAPSATVLALTAAGEAAFTESALNAAINASATAAEAIASSAATAVDNAQYDGVHEETFHGERQAQLELLRQMSAIARN